MLTWRVVLIIEWLVVEMLTLQGGMFVAVVFHVDFSLISPQNT